MEGRCSLHRIALLFVIWLDSAPAWEEAFYADGVNHVFGSDRSEVRDGKGAHSIATIRCSDQGEERAVLTNGQQLSIRGHSSTEVKSGEDYLT
jgi:hypothetical protein